MALNRLMKKTVRADPLLTATLAVLENYDVLDSFSYDEDEDEDDFQGYTESILGPMINLVNYE